MLRRNIRSSGENGREEHSEQRCYVTNHTEIFPQHFKPRRQKGLGCSGGGRNKEPREKAQQEDISEKYATQSVVQGAGSMGITWELV